MFQRRDYKFDLSKTVNNSDALQLLELRSLL